jgi:predicted PurR-regulated permease PerM
MLPAQTDDRSQRDWPRIAALAALTVVGVYLCYRLASPFLPAIAWALALTIIALPLHRWISRHVRSPNFAAALSTLAVVLTIAVPIGLVAGQLAGESKRAAVKVKEQTDDGRWRETAAKMPYVGEYLVQLDANEIEGQIRERTTQLVGRSFGVMEGIAGGLLQALVAVFILFFCLRDRHHLLNQVRKMVPLAPEAADGIFERAEDAVYATVYGTLLAAVLQGVMGGLMFWWLGLPAPVLWGVVMVVLGILPFVGAFLVWVPAALYLVSIDRYGAAAALTAWGLIMAGPVCNYVYAYFAGDRMRMHPVPTLLSFIGGLVVFGVSGMILGPCVLAVTAALLSMWRHRTADGTPVAAQTDEPTSNLQEANHALARG